MTVNILCEAAVFSRMHGSYSQLSQNAPCQGPSASSLDKEETPHPHSPDVASEIKAAEKDSAASGARAALSGAHDMSMLGARGSQVTAPGR